MTNITKKREVKRNDLVYHGLSYEIIGGAYQVMNKIGSGNPETVYEKAMAIKFSKGDIVFKRLVNIGIRKYL